MRSCANVVRAGRDRCCSSLCIGGGMVFMTLFGGCELT